MTQPSLLPAGKLPAALLRRFLNKLRASSKGRDSRTRDARVVVGPGIGLDAAAIEFGDRYLIAKTDPITFVTGDLSTYALTINANDLATMGATPRWFLATVLLPAGRTTRTEVSRLFAQLGRACRTLHVVLCGGHTEITEAVTRPMVVGCLLGECRKDRLLTTAGARIGDAVLLTKGIPIEAVSILARERGRELAQRYPARFVARCRRYLIDPGISVLRDAEVARAAGGVHAMHDPTEGGLSAALYELAEAAGVGLRIEQCAITVLPEGARLCADLGVSPLGAIASGALLLCTDPARESAIRTRLAGAGIKAARIGTVVPVREGVSLVTEEGRRRPFPRFAVDELARLFSAKEAASETWRVRAESSPGSRSADTAS